MSSFSLRQHKAIEMLAQGIIQREVAKEVGISQRALTKWLAKEEFKVAVHSRTSELAKIKRILTVEKIEFELEDINIEEMVGLAKKALFDLLREGESEKVRFLAARFILDRYEPLSSDTQPVDFSALLKRIKSA